MAMQSVSPINQLPREILAEIFWSSMPETTESPAQTMLRRAAPLLPCSVCSSWRELALTMPELWTSVGIIIRNPNVDPSAADRVVSAWLKRSGTLPLKLYLVQLSPHHDVARFILSAFYLHSSRWQDVNFSLHKVPSLSLPPWLDTPLLQSLHHSGWGGNKFPFRRIPRLTELSWPSPIDAPRDTQIPWSQISRLHILNGPSLSSLLEMIHLCPQLEEFQVGCLDSDEVVDLPHEPKVEHGHLRQLELLDYECIEPLLRLLTLPALEQLTCSTENDENVPVVPTDLHESLLDFLTRSNCKLQKLKLGDSQLSSDGFLECLEHEASKTIQELIIEGWPRLTDDVLLRLTYPPSPAAPRILLPKLTHLTLEYCVDASPGKLGEMISSRYYRETDEVEGLKVLVLEAGNMDKEDETIINNLAGDGLGGKIDIVSRR